MAGKLAECQKIVRKCQIIKNFCHFWQKKCIFGCLVETPLFSLLLYNEGGNVYDSEEKKTLLTAKTDITEIIIDKNVESIAGGSSSTSSAFYFCRTTMSNVSFEESSKLNELGIKVFSGTTLKNIDFSNCVSLKAISQGCFSGCSKLTNIKFPPFLEVIDSAAFHSAGITEIQPYNLSELVKLIIHKILQSMLSIKWRYASANSVIQVINKSFQAISTKLLDEDLLIKFILPFEHKELSFSDIQLYSNKILSMQLDMINLPKSRQCIPGSTWPKFFYENAKFTLQNFFVPMSVKFNQTLFINSVIECVDNQSPSETIYQ